MTAPAGSNYIYTAPASGPICLEVEHATRIASGPDGDLELTTVNTPSESALQAVKPNGFASIYSTWEAADAPYAEFELTDVPTGDYRVWLRTHRDEDEAGHDTTLVGATGGTPVGIFARHRFNGFASGWGWEDSRFSGDKLTLAGDVTLRIQLREPLLKHDRILFTTDTGYDPSTVAGGVGPAALLPPFGGGGRRTPALVTGEGGLLP
ncbi:MAG: hypothetical protein AAGD32_05280 [Planctomycetota bacterium]